MSLWCDRVFKSGLLFLILATPFAFGTVHPWAYSAMEAIVFGLVIVWMLKLAYLVRSRKSEVRSQMSEFDKSASRLTPHASRLTSLGLPLGLFTLLAVFQLVPLPPSWLRVLSPATFEAYTQIIPGWPVRVP
jgi:hypothetical protein